jgi:hypothetical protein
MPDVPENMMERLPHYRSKYNAAKKIHVYFIPMRDKYSGQKLYFYAITSEVLHEQMLACLRYNGAIPDYAVVVEKGEGEPPREVKAKMKAFYGFDHDAIIIKTKKEKIDDAKAGA